MAGPGSPAEPLASDVIVVGGGLSGDLRRRFATTSAGTGRQGALRPSQTGLAVRR
jgi:hypothetical protein